MIPAVEEITTTSPERWARMTGRTARVTFSAPNRVVSTCSPEVLRGDFLEEPGVEVTCVVAPGSPSSTPAPATSGPTGSAPPTTAWPSCAPEAGDDPYNQALTSLVGELSTRSEAFRTRWAAHNVRLHRTGLKHFHHPVVGDLHLNFEAMELPADPGMSLLASAPPPAHPMTMPCGSSPAGPPPTTRRMLSKYPPRPLADLRGPFRAVGLLCGEGDPFAAWSGQLRCRRGPLITIASHEGRRTASSRGRASFPGICTLHRAVLTVQFGDHRAVSDIERGEQAGHAMAAIVVGAPRHAEHHRLGPVQGLQPPRFSSKHSTTAFSSGW